jgi:glycine cleavage system H protein
VVREVAAVGVPILFTIGATRYGVGHRRWGGEARLVAPRRKDSIAFAQLLFRNLVDRASGLGIFAQGFTSMDPQSLKFAKSHEWIFIEGDTATVGISAFAVRQLTDLVYVGLPAVGKKFAAGQVFGEVESVKAVSDLYAPVAGEVIAVNNSLEEDLGVLSSDPYGKGWIIKLKVADPSEAGKLLDRKAYEAHCESEEQH